MAAEERKDKERMRIRNVIGAPFFESETGQRWRWGEDKELTREEIRAPKDHAVRFRKPPFYVEGWYDS